MTDAQAPSGTAGHEPERQAVLDDIGQTRERLGATVEELAARADVPARLRRQAAGAAGTARQRYQGGLAAVRQRPEVILGATAVVTFTLAVWLMFRARRP